MRKRTARMQAGLRRKREAGAVEGNRAEATGVCLRGAWMNRRAAWTGAAVLLLTLSATGQEVVVVTTRDQIRSRGVRFDPGKGLMRVEEPGRWIPAKQLVSLRFKGAGIRDPKPPATEVVLYNGDTLYGTIESESDTALRLRTGFGSLGLPFDHLRLVRNLAVRGFRRSKDSDEDGDRVRLRSGETDVGVVKSIGRSGVGFHSNVLQEDVRYPMKEVAAVMFEPLRVRSDFEPGEGFASVTLRDGSSVHGNVEWLAGDRMCLECEVPSIGTVEIPVGRVLGIVFHNGNLVYLSEREPERVVSRPFVGPGSRIVRFRRDRSVAGGDLPIRLDGRPYRHGIGMHSFCEATWDLGGAFHFFQGVAGIDDSARGGGSVVFRVLADGREIYNSGLVVGRDWVDRLKGKTGPIPIRLKVEGVKKLTLRVECGPDDDVLDRAAWAEAWLIR